MQIDYVSRPVIYKGATKCINIDINLQGYVKNGNGVLYQKKIEGENMQVVTM